MARTGQDKTKAAKNTIYGNIQTTWKGFILMNLIGGFLFLPVLLVVNVVKCLWWIVSNAWWAVLILCIYALFKRHKKNL